MQGSRDYIKYLKRGYSRISQNMASELRNGNITPREAKKLIKEEGKKPQSLDIFLKFINMSEKEFYTIISDNIIYPNSFKKIKRKSKKTKDFASWYKE